MCRFARLLIAALAQDSTASDPAAGLTGLLRYSTLGAHAEQSGDPAAE